MNMKIAWKPGQNILFVCYGNTVRSPMAEGLAKNALEDKAHIESAGISPSFTGAQPEAVRVMQDLFGIDISSHRTRDVIDLEMDRFDWIIALDPYVYEALKSKYRWAHDLLHLWDIDDPYGKTVEDYKKCARLVQHYVQKCL